MLARAGQAAFPGLGRSTLTPQEQEIQRLRKEVEILRQEREILKKAAAFFAKENGGILRKLLRNAK